MPLYEYQCGQCGRFETIQKFSDPVLTACPTCGREVEKLLSSPAIQFKGTGWYITDYARKSSGGGKSEGGKSEGGKSDKPAGGKSEGASSEGSSSAKAAPAASSGSGSGSGSSDSGAKS
jgi:putative FmdB family regulatory protein